MLFHRALLRAGGLLLLANCSVAFSQSNPAHNQTDQELKEAGLSEERIAELHAEMLPKQPSAGSSDAVVSEPAIGYSSVFESYVPFDYVPDIGWREANDRVGEIGGWRAYLKMVQEGQLPDTEQEDKNQ